MGSVSKVRCIQRKDGEQWYVELPSAVAEAMELAPGEEIEWVIVDKEDLLVRRVEPTSTTSKKNGPTITRFL